MIHKVIQKTKRLIEKRKYPQFGRHNAPNWEKACELLAYIAELYQNEAPHPALVIGGGSDTLQLLQALESKSKSYLTSQADKGSIEEALADSTYSCILIGSSESREQYRLAQVIMNLPAAKEIPLEYVALPLKEGASLKHLDLYQDGDFVSPLHIKHGHIVADIYLESLQKFEQKTDVRDYLDLWQILNEITRREVKGYIAEFGSYKGHSGYLMSRILQHLNSHKELFMFDMFESFPVESIGIDAFWSKTHHVDFEEVSSKFSGIERVNLIQGDFTQTLPRTDTGPLSFAYIDCDSYRGTQFLLEELWEKSISPGGVVALEDYGHAALLGNRVAAHEFFDSRTDAHVFFSQFSGFFVATKLK